MHISNVRAELHPLEIARMRTQARYALIAKAAVIFYTLTSPGWLSLLFFTDRKWLPYISSLFFVPLLALLCTWGFTFVWGDDRFLRLLFGAGILARLANTGLYIWVGYVVYNSGADAFRYWTAGYQTADAFVSLGWSAFQPPYWSSNFIKYVCAGFTIVFGSSVQTLFVLFAFAALWGGFFLYRAFCVAFPQGDHRLFGLLIVLSPSIVFWSSAIGKDALAQLFIGMTAFAYARIRSRLTSRLIALCAIGVCGMLFVRPHIAAILAISITVPFVIGRRHGGWKLAAAKVVLIPLLFLGTGILVVKAKSFVEETTSSAGILTADQVTKNDQYGGSAFNQNQSLPVRVAQAPFLIFRPFPWEAHGSMALIASAEGLAFLWLAWKKRKMIRAAFRDWRDPFTAFILTFALLFTLMFAATSSNFGILVRQRIMVLPLMLMLFCSRQRLPATLPYLYQPRFRSPMLARTLPAPRMRRSPF